MTTNDVVWQLAEKIGALAIAGKPDYTALGFALSCAELGAGDVAVAIATELERAQAKVDANWLSRFPLIYAMAGRRDEVQRLVARCEPLLQGDCVRSCANIAAAFEHLGDAEDAEAYFERTPKPYREQALRRMFALALQRGQLARAEAHAERPYLRVLGFRPLLAKLRCDLGRAHALAGDRPAAMRWLDRAIELLAPPKERDPNLEIATAAAELGDTARGLEIARAVDQAAFTGKDAYTAPESIDLARAYAAAGEVEKVRAILDTQIAFHRDGAAALAHNASKCFELGRPMRGLPLLRTAESRLETESDKKQARAAVARAWADAGDFARAITHASAVADAEARAHTLVFIAGRVRERGIEDTPELAAALEALR